MDLNYLNDLRSAEIDQVLTWFRPVFAGKRVLEIGSGTGIQLDRLSDIAGQLVGLDLADGTYAEAADDRVVTYDGHHIPFADDSFDVVFSSNVLEHIAHRREFQAEIARVLALDGQCVHVLPTHTWKFWTTVASLVLFPKSLVIGAAVTLRDRKWKLPKTGGQLIDLLIGPRHGEFGTRLTEYNHFKPSEWAKVFRETGWKVDAMRPMELFYEGNSVLGSRLGIAQRERLAKVVGSACSLFVLSRQRQSTVDS
ncbi:MAG: methyltransferase domain-containing protein [Croceibacterium sp.]